MQIARLSFLLASALTLLAFPAIQAGAASFLTEPGGEPQPVASSALLEPGDTLTARATFEPPKIEEFKLEVLSLTGVRQRTGKVPHFFGFIARAYGGPVEKHRGLPDGVSGAPVYLDGKLVGAIRSIIRPEYGSKDIVLVITIEELERLLSLPSMQSPETYQSQKTEYDQTPANDENQGEPDLISLNPPLRLDGRTYAYATERWLSQSEKVVAFKPASRIRILGTELTEQDLPPTWYRRWKSLAWAPIFSPDVPVPTKPGVPTPLKPGAPVSLLVAKGGLPLSISGTLTAVDDEGRFIAFGHSVLDMKGTVNLPLAQELIFANFISLTGNWQLSQPGPIVGTIREDRLQGVAGFLGEYRGDFVDLKVTAKDRTTGRGGEDSYQLASHPDLIVDNLPMLALFGLTKLIDNESYGTVKVDYELRLSGREEPITYTNLYHSSFAVAAASGELSQALRKLFFNDREEFKLEEVSLTADFTQQRHTARISGAELGVMEEGEFKPLEPAPDGSYEVSAKATLAVMVKLFPYRGKEEERLVVLSGDEVERHGEVRPGRWVVQVRGGSGTLPYQHDVYPAYLEKLKEEARRVVRYYQPPPPETGEEVLNLLFPPETNDLLIVELINPSERLRDDEGYIPSVRKTEVAYPDTPTVVMGFKRFDVRLK